MATAAVKEIRTQLLVQLLAHVKSHDAETYAVVRDQDPTERRFTITKGLGCVADEDDIAEAFRRLDTP